MSEYAQEAGMAQAQAQAIMKPQPDGEVTTATRDLNNVVEMVVHQLDQLADRISPALRPSGPEVADIAQKLTGGASGVGVADEIWAQVHRLTVTANRLRDLNERVAL